MKYSIRKCVMDDLSVLREFSRQTFDDTFRRLNTPENMKAYLEQAFDISKLSEQLSNNHSAFYFLFMNEELSGYLKVNEHEAQTDIYDPQSLEIERIYVRKDLHGKGLGSRLMDKALKIAQIKGKSYIWLGVWEKNQKAIEFYKNNGFYAIGKHSFVMGDEEQADYLMRKDLIHIADQVSQWKLL
ncbi:MAG: GNAT family N-acetyltransferase [Peptococcaceae bacterium]|nr:GNAT family N-acetyltransferase [Peptococcaceae bacterium]